MQFINLAAQYAHTKTRIDKRIQSVLDHGKYIAGPEVQELEEKLANYVGVKHVITCANGTDALQLALMVLNVKEGDAVFCPTFTFFASAEVIAFSKATPVFVDSDPSSFNLCPSHLEQQIEKTIAQGKYNPKAIIAVDLFGHPADYQALSKIAKKYGLKLIEDAAQGFGGRIGDHRCGSFGDMATTSFFPAKPLGCYGDGGAIFTNNDAYAGLLRSYCVHGKGKDNYDNIRIGMNSRLDTIQAAVLIEKLVEFPSELEARDRVASVYCDALKSIVKVPVVAKECFSSWAQYTLVATNRDELVMRLKKAKVPSMIYYRKGMHQQEAFRHLGYSDGDFPVAESLTQKVFSLPMHPYLKDDEMCSIIRVLTEA
nr:DegT/DnrJ/EryC1/StrS family aminotransferase [Rhodospirillales bacterium]